MSRIEATVPDRFQKVVIYCASGARSALAANTVVCDLGYQLIVDGVDNFPTRYPSARTRSAPDSTLARRA